MPESPKPLTRSGFLRVALSLAAMLALTVPAVAVHGPAMAQNGVIRGNATALDGATLLIVDKKVRLYGVTAPDKAQKCKINAAVTRCGVIAWAELIRRAEGVYLSCDVEKKAQKTPGHIVATCYAGEHDIAEHMVRSGWAKARYGETERYKVDEDAARQGERGLWGGEILPMAKTPTTPGEKAVSVVQSAIKEEKTASKPVKTEGKVKKSPE